ncbi:MAG: hypothetical protein JSW33_13200 [bacterium]|nr:MAG: hypothetical protein JSW33_13200 [bacterium]
MNQSYSHYSETAGSLLVSIIPNFTEPVDVGTNDSLNISITIQNPSVSPFPWLAYVSELSGDEKKEVSLLSWKQSSMPVVFIITLCRRGKTGISEK